ncbi:hypothetical protein N0V88_000292 [Collariella sp. IMI 366227]|nr:hypothetical protein N0V88_000292 [Collariella sp. IMI 366227]
MSSQKFKADVTTAGEKAAHGAVPGILSVLNGDCPGEVVIKYLHQDLLKDTRIQALAQDVAEYPDGNMFMVWTDDDDPPAPVAAAIRTAQDYLVGMSVYEMVLELAAHLNREISGVSLEPEEADADGEDDEFDVASDDDFFSDDQFGLPSSVPRHTHRNVALPDNQKPLLQRIKRDLRQVNHAGYKVGLLDGLGKTATHGIVSISIRIDKLALSEQAMEAWDVSPAEYLVLLFRFPRRYSPFETVLLQEAAHTEVSFRIGKCNRYKPSLNQALGAFLESSQRLVGKADDLVSDASTREGADFEKLFVSNSLDQFMCDSFMSLLKLREAKGLSWEEANETLHTRMGFFGEDDQLPETEPGASPPPSDEAAERHTALGPDHLAEQGSKGERSFPLIAMQFAMRYFVRCTEYCLRCHRRLEKGFEALRPYVCSQPLCLFQYMAMGFGPSIEHEILTEPYVVDLLVSLCYVAIQPFFHTSPLKLPIRDLPTGLRLMVPDLSETMGHPLKARLEAESTRLVFGEDQGPGGFGGLLAPTKWLALRRPGQSSTLHARIQEINTASRTALIEITGQSAVYWNSTTTSSTYSASPPVYGVSDPLEEGIVDVFPYSADFDSLKDVATQGLVMRHILDTLPSILNIADWLNSHPHSTIRSMGRVSPAAASLLQWIVSSNRSCIFQVDRARPLPRPQTSGSSSNTKTKDSESQEYPEVAGKGRNREHERIEGMDEWLQFRFAQGSPDKELRFHRSLQAVAARKPIQLHPTIFAWHGSSLANWHSIVRTGLDFNDTRNGRAFGNGVYFSPQCATSLGYTSAGGPTWPNSDLGIISCLSLNEIINAPDEFVSSSPHYVVSQADWHQCRYLFVKTSQLKPPVKKAWKTEKNQPTQTEDKQRFHPQALGREVQGQAAQLLRIPLSAIPLRVIGTSSERQSSPSKRTAQRLEDSDSEDSEDVAALFSDDEFDIIKSPPSKKSASLASRCPSVDSESAQTTRELNRLATIQQKTPLHELGWYIDCAAVTNLFQWIVQLHSFDPTLPLAQDMKAAGVTAVVLEVRFPADFPFSPPFDYGVAEALEAFVRAARMHGWAVPEGMSTTAYGV